VRASMYLTTSQVEANYRVWRTKSPLTQRECAAVYVARKVCRVYPTTQPPSPRRFSARKAEIRTDCRRNELSLGRIGIPSADLRQRARTGLSSEHRHGSQRLLHVPFGTWSSDSVWWLAIPNSGDTVCLRRGNSLDAVVRSFGSLRRKIHPRFDRLVLRLIADGIKLPGDPK
jgi:hypothetical protein